MVCNVDKVFQKLGVYCIGQVGEGDDGVGIMEEDFLVWKDFMWKVFVEKMGFEECEVVYEFVFGIVECDIFIVEFFEVYFGEFNKIYFDGIFKGFFNVYNFYIVFIVEFYELFNVKDCNCFYMEVDISVFNFSYQIGDYFVVWFINFGEEVDWFFNVLGFIEKCKDVIFVKVLEFIVKVFFLIFIIFDVIVCYYMEICVFVFC